MRSAISRVLAAMFFSWLLLASPVFADLTGDVQGTVSDPTGAGVAGAKVSIKNLATGQTRVVIASQSGEYSAPQMEIGSYQISVEKDGFKTYTQTVVVRSGEKTRVDAQMQIGKVTETIVVESGALPTLDVATAQVSNSINAEEVLALPNQARDPVVFATLSPGTVPVGLNNSFLGTGNFNSNGSRGRANNITLDGVTGTDISTTGEGGGLVMSQDAIAEVKVITNNFDAEFGRDSGSQVQIITKAGTNQYHGSAYWYHQNAALGNARDYFDTTGHVTPIIQSQGGVTFGAPVIKNHTFFFGNWEVDRTAGAGASTVANVLTSAQAAAITSPTSLALFKADGSPSSADGTLSGTSANTTRGDFWTLRVDQLLRGGKDTLSVKYGQNPLTQVTPGDTFVLTNLPGFGASATSEARTLTFGYTAALSSNIADQFHFNFGRSNPDFAINSPFAPGPTISIAGLDNFGTSFIIPQGRTQNTFQYLDTLSWVKGRHTFKFGADINRYQSPSTSDFFTRGQISFATVADFEAGNPNAYFQQVGNFTRHNFALDAFFFAQDDFRLTNTLTLNLGFRLESSGGVSEGANLISNLDPNNHAPIGALGTGPLGGIDVGGDAFHRNWNPAPRLGFAWNPGHGKLVVRGGYGITYDFIYQNPISNIQFSAPFINGVSVASFTGGNTFANLVAGTAPAQAAAIAALGTFSPTQIDFGALSPVDQHLKNPRTQQYDAGVEYQLRPDLVVKVTFVGSHSDHLQVSIPINLVNPANIPAAPTSLADQNARIAQFQAVSQSEVFGGPINANQQNILIDPRFDNVTQVQSVGVSSYNSLQVEGIRRFRNGLTFDANYTWAHSLDDTSDALNVLQNDNSALLDAVKGVAFNRSNSQFDVRHRVVLSYNYEIPFTKHFHGWRRTLLDGWSQSGIFTSQSGLPATVYAAPIDGINDTLLNGTDVNGATTTTPLNGDATQLHPVPFHTGYTVPTSLQVSEPLLEQDGTSGRNHLRLDGLTDLDLQVSKLFKITESKSFQLRWESFNALNHPNFNNYQNSFASPIFNTYVTTATNMRQMQVTAKFVF
jgi:Carboxypeptidase regulatory-like domain